MGINQQKLMEFMNKAVGDIGAAASAVMAIIVTQGGFKRFRRATQTPFNLILEARP